jgi:hypothetical protein
MPKSKISVTIPAEVLAQAERNLALPGETRSALLSRILAAAVRASLEQQYAEGYERMPVTMEEDAALEAAAREGFADIQAQERARGHLWQRRAAR